MASLWKLGGLSWHALAKRVWAEIQNDNVFGRAAELSYYFLLALFPFLIFLTSIIGLVLGSGTGTRHALFDYLARIMPPSAFQLIDNTMTEVSAVEWWRKVVVWNSGGVVGRIEWSRCDHGVAQYCVRSEGNATVVETAVDCDWIDDGAFGFDYWRAGPGGCWWTHCGVAGCNYGFGPVFPTRMEDHSVAGCACVYDLRLCADLLLCARLSQTGVAMVNAGIGDRSCTLVTRVTRISRLSSFL